MALSDKYDDFYSSNDATPHIHMSPRSRWPRDRVAAILLEAGAGGTVLDVGCGDGQLLYHLSGRYETLMGLEYSEVRLQKAMELLSTFNFFGFLGSAEAMDQIPSETVDTIVSADVIEHIPDVYAASGEMFRVLKPGGIAVINTPNVAFIKKRLLLAAGRFPSTSQPNEGLGSDILFDGGHLHYFTFRSVCLLLEKAGFEIVRRTGFGVLGPLSRIRPALLSSGVQVVARRPAAS